MLIEVCFASTAAQVLLAVNVPEGTTVMQAIKLSDIEKQCPEIDLARHKVGIFSRLVDLAHPLKTGDRVEIYRPLTIDPKTARLQKAKASRQTSTS